MSVSKLPAEAAVVLTQNVNQQHRQQQWQKQSSPP
jgi:hypothetical protein